MGTRIVVVLVVVAFLGGLGSGWAIFRAVPETPTIVFNSTQLAPEAETEFVVDELLPPFEDEFGVLVQWIPEESYAIFEDRLLSEAEAEKVRVTVSGGLHGDFSLLTEEGYLRDLSGMSLPDRTFIQTLWDLSISDEKQNYVPWMQATYIFVANKQARQYLPTGADENALTYDELKDWAKAIFDATGEKKFGLPAGPGGLLHRFVHGYLYPSFTGKTVADFNTAEAVTMWQYMEDLWQYVHPSSPTWKEMSPALRDGDVWLAWDHTARFKEAVLAAPDDYVVLPSPSGPAGRGFITVAVGLAMLEGGPHPEAGEQLIEYLTRPATQVDIAEGVGFFPVVEEAVPVFPEGGLKIIAEGVSAQSGSADAIAAMIPGGLGGRSGEFSDIYRDTFYRILGIGVPAEAIQDVLDDQGAKLTALYQDTGAEFPLPG